MPPSHDPIRNTRSIDGWGFCTHKKYSDEIAFYFSSHEKIKLFWCRKHRLKRDPFMFRQQFFSSLPRPFCRLFYCVPIVPPTKTLLSNIIRVQVLYAFTPMILLQSPRNRCFPRPIWPRNNQQYRSHFPLSTFHLAIVCANTTRFCAAIEAWSFRCASSLSAATCANARLMSSFSSSSVGS